MSLLIEHAVPIIVGILLLVGLIILKGNDALNATGVVIVSLLATVPVFLALRTALSDMVKGAYMNVVRDPDYRGRMGVLDLTQADILFSLARLVDDDHPAIVFIDDLDRCFPAHVAEVIGAINLFLANNHRSCIFVLGMDTEVVAASLEVVHEKVVGKVSKRDGELGWNYMDKFVQLPIALPRVQEDDRLAYFRDLLAGRSNNVHPITSSIATEAVGLNERADLLTDNIHDLGAHLSLNPRTLVKIANIFRFQVLLQAARKNAGSEPASEQQILLWSIVFARWPHFVRWLQRLPTEKSRESPALGRIIERARMTNSADAWATELDTDGFDHGGWAQTPGLWEFFHKETAAPDLEQASKVGFW